MSETMENETEGVTYFPFLFDFPSEKEEQKLFVAKIAVFFVTIYGLFTSLAPLKEIKLYGIYTDNEKPNPVHVYLAHKCGSVINACCVTWWCFNVWNLSAIKSLGFGNLPLIISDLHSILNDKPKELGGKSSVLYFNVMLFTAAAYHCLYELQPLATRLFQVQVAWGFFNGVLLFLSPEIFAKTYGIPSREKIILTARKMYGIDLISCCIQASCLLAGIDGLTALAYGWLIPALLFLSMTFVTKDWDEKIPMHLVMFWPIFLTAISLYMLL